MSREDCAGLTTLALKLGGSAPSSGPFWLAACVLSTGRKFSVNTRFWHARWDTTIVMAVHNNDNILMVHYEDLPDEDKDTINKATEEVFVVLHQNT